MLNDRMPGFVHMMQGATPMKLNTLPLPANKKY
jgi:hypothetical protein